MTTKHKKLTVRRGPKKVEPTFDAGFRQWTRGVSFALTMGKLQVAILTSIHLSKGLRNDLSTFHIGFGARRLQNWVTGTRALQDRGLLVHFDAENPPAKKGFSHPMCRTIVFSSNKKGEGIWRITEAGEHVVALLKISGIYQELQREYEEVDRQRGHDKRREFA